MEMETHSLYLFNLKGHFLNTSRESIFPEANNISKATTTIAISSKSIDGL
jgi:hypothetical protein